jgi:hypothetical protein
MARNENPANDSKCLISSFGVAPSAIAIQIGVPAGVCTLNPRNDVMPKDDNPSDVAAERVSFDYPPLGGVTVASQLVGSGVRMYVPLAELRQLLEAASRMSTRLGLFVAGVRHAANELAMVAVADSSAICRSLILKHFELFSDPTAHPLTAIAAHCNYSIEARTAVAGLFTALDEIDSWIQSQRSQAVLSPPASELSPRITRCIEALAAEVNRIDPAGSTQIPPDRVDEFARLLTIERSAVPSEAIKGVRNLDERTELEPFIREILCDRNATPHCPTEIADILTAQVHVDGRARFTAFVNKGKATAKVSSKNTSHQLLKARTIPNLELIALVAVGEIQDDIKRDLARCAIDGGTDYMIVDVIDIARLFMAYRMICRRHGRPLTGAARCQECKVAAEVLDSAKLNDSRPV